MTQWWNSMLMFERVMFCIALAASVLLIIQLILLFVGMGASDADADIDLDTDSDVDSDAASLFGLKLFSIRGLIGFLAVGGWVALLCSTLGLPVWGASLIGLGAGLVTAVLIALFYKWMEHMENDGNIDIKTAVGKFGTAYIPVPAKGQGKGKVTVTMDERIVEYDAVSEEEELIPTNAAVEVTSIRDETTLVVKRA